MGMTKKLHRRLVKKSHEVKLHRKAIRVMYQALSVYANPDNWFDTDDTRDVIQNGVVIGMERVRQWRGPGTGPGLAESLLSSVVSKKEKEVKANEADKH